MKAVLALVLVFATLSCVFAQGPSESFVIAHKERYSWETIFSNNTSYLDEIDAHRGIIYVAGGGRVREVVEEPFEISYHHRFFRQEHSFIDFKVFNHHNITYVFGPVPSYHVANDTGLDHPLELGNHSHSETTAMSWARRHGEYQVQLAAVSVTYWNSTNVDWHVVSYAAGWRITTDRHGAIVANFSVWRLYLHPYRIGNGDGSFVSGNPYHTDNVTDHVTLTDNGYVEYTREYKPWVFHSYMREITLVVEPSTRTIFKFNAPNNPNISFSLISQYNPIHYSHISSVEYDHNTGILYIGTRGDGSSAGSIIAVDTTPTSMATLWVKTLGHYESNPKSLSIHGHGLYVGLHGSSTIIHLNISREAGGAIIGYATLPWYIRNVNDIHATMHHVYVVTNEQHSKIARTGRHHFCKTPCDSEFGFCDKGKCTCHPSHKLDKNGIRCLPNYTINKSGKGGEVALGLLFALFFIAAVTGWVVVYRQKNGLSVPFIGGSNSRYNLVHAEDKEGLLGSD